MQLTYVDPQGKKTQAVSGDSKNIPVVNVGIPLAVKKPVNTSQNQTAVSTPDNSVNNTVSSTGIKLAGGPQVQAKPRSTPFLKAEEFRQFIEREVLKIIKDLAEKGAASEEKLQAMAKLTLELIKPGMTLEELYTNAVKLDDQYLELSPVVFHIMKEYEEKYEKKALTHVSQLIRSGQYEAAQEMVKKVLKFKVKS